MENEIQSIKPIEPVKNRKNYFLPASIVTSSLIMSVAWITVTALKTADNKREYYANEPQLSSYVLEEAAVPKSGFAIPVYWADLGVKMAASGVIDKQKFEAAYAQRGGLSSDEKKLIKDNVSGKIIITPENSGHLLNLFWALGLGNKNSILDNGPISDPAYGSAGGFASTGGWTLAKGDAMTHFSMHPFINLTPEQQSLVERVSKNIYRPCCGNSTYFSDCNHGMAMLGLIELMASHGVSEEEMYKTALKVNSYWFPDTYITIAKYLNGKGISWENANPKEILGADFSSGEGYRRILSQIPSPSSPQKGGDCGV